MLEMTFHAVLGPPARNMINLIALNFVITYDRLGTKPVRRRQLPRQIHVAAAKTQFLLRGNLIIFRKEKSFSYKFCVDVI